LPKAIPQNKAKSTNFVKKVAVLIIF